MGKRFKPPNTFKEIIYCKGYDSKTCYSVRATVRLSKY